MKIILLVLFLIPVFIFQSFIIVDTINVIKIPQKKSLHNTGSIRFNERNMPNKTRLKVVK